MKKIVAIALLLLPILTYAEDEAMTGNKLLRWMESTNSNERVFARGYVSGFTEGIVGSNVLLNAKQVACLPEGVTYTQLNDIIHNYLKKEPKYRHKVATFLIIASIREAYPCT